MIYKQKMLKTSLYVDDAQATFCYITSIVQIINDVYVPSIVDENY